MSYGCCDFLQVCAGALHQSAASCCSMTTSDKVHYAGDNVWYFALLPATLWTKPLLVVSLSTFSHLWTLCKFLRFHYALNYCKRLEQLHPVEPLLFSPRTINYTQNANPLTDRGVYSTVYTAAIFVFLTGAPELQKMATVSLSEYKTFLECTKSGLYKSRTFGEAKLSAMWCHPS
jgi:hypothetical protein